MATTSSVNLGPALTSVGVGSGLDVNSIVTQLMSIERKPIEILQTQYDKLGAKLSSFGKIQSYLDSLRTASRALTDTTTWKAATASSSDSAAVAASVADGATPGSYSVQVNHLAAAQMNATSALASASTAVGQGTLRIEVGSWEDDLSDFTPKTGTTAVDITIGPGEDTLEQIRDKINGTANVGVRASIVNDATGARLVLQSTASGVENGFRVQVTDDDGIGDDDSGLSRLAYDPANGAGVSTRSQPAVNAQALINGLPVESATNTLDNVIDGLTLKLGKQTVGTVDVTVSRDSASMRKSVDTFVTAYNDLVKLLRDQTKYDEANKSSATLQGDRTAIGIQGQLRAALGLGTTASSVFTRASDIGLSVQTDGTIKVTGSKLDAAIANVDEIRKFFATTSDTPGAEGVGVRLRALTDQLLGSDGSVTTRQTSLRKLQSLNTDRQQQLEDRVAATEKRMRAQYQALDTNMARLSSLQNYVTQQINNWNKS